MEKFRDEEFRPYLRSEICVLDMLCSVFSMKDGQYRKMLVVKGGHSVRKMVSLESHRFSFDADFNPNSVDGYTYGDV